MKLGNIGNILIAGMIVFLYTSIGGGIIAYSAPQITRLEYYDEWRVSGEIQEAGFYNVTVTDQDSLQYKLGVFLLYPGSILLALPAIFVNRLNGWWKKR